MLLYVVIPMMVFMFVLEMVGNEEENRTKGGRD